MDLPTLKDKDVDKIQNWGCKHGLNFIAASFVRKASNVKHVREVLGYHMNQIRVIFKIGNLEGRENYDAILAEADGLMVARGVLDIDIPPERVFLAQKMMICEDNIVANRVITARYILERMMMNPRPTQAECSDVANAVMDGTDCVILSGYMVD